MTRDEILAAVLGDADLLWAVAASLDQHGVGGVRVAGPWVRTPRESHRPGFYDDRDYGIGMFASVKWYKATTKLAERWKAIVVLDGSMLQPFYDGSPDFWSLAEAESWCDARLREAGVMLATGSAP